MESVRLLLVTTTRYEDTDAGNVRWALAQRTAAEASAAGYTLVVVDGSPEGPVADAVAAALTARGARVLPQRADPASPGGGATAMTKGAALRQALAAAAAEAAATTEAANNEPGSVKRPLTTLVAFQEPEKWAMVAQWAAVVDAVCAQCSATGQHAGVVAIPQRTDAAWASYPVEQQHSELFGNAHVANLLRAAAQQQQQQQQQQERQALDWFFGPFLVSSDLLPGFAAYDGKWWDAQIVPLLRAVRASAAAGGPAPLSVPVDFVCDPRQRAEEEGSVAYGRKRLHQLHYLFPLLEAALLPVQQ